MESKSVKTDFFLMLLLFVLSIIFYFVIIPAQIPARSSWGTDAVFTSRTFPQILAIIVAIASLLGVANTAYRFFKIKKTMPGGATVPKEKSGTSILQVVYPYFICGIIILYGVLFDKIGFAVSTLVMAPALLFLLGCKNWKHYVAILVFTGAVFIIFRYGLKVMLP